MIKEMTLKEFEQIKDKGSVVVEFFTTWCGDCHMMAPTFSNLAEKYKDKDVQFIKVNAEEGNVFKSESGYDVQKVPTFIFYKDGKEMGRCIEYNPINKLEELTERTI